jgi:hypothetical protein
MGTDATARLYCWPVGCPFPIHDKWNLYQAVNGYLPRFADWPGVPRPAAPRTTILGKNCGAKFWALIVFLRDLLPGAVSKFADLVSD